MKAEKLKDFSWAISLWKKNAAALTGGVLRTLPLTFVAEFLRIF
jgi:hypothetical protein